MIIIERPLIIDKAKIREFEVVIDRPLIDYSTTTDSWIWGQVVASRAASIGAILEVGIIVYCTSIDNCTKIPETILIINRAGVGNVAKVTDFTGVDKVPIIF